MTYCNQQINAEIKKIGIRHDKRNTMKNIESKTQKVFIINR